MSAFPTCSSVPTFSEPVFKFFKRLVCSCVTLNSSRAGFPSPSCRACGGDPRVRDGKMGRGKKRVKRLTLLLGICQTHAAELMFTRAARWAIQHVTRLAWKNHGEMDWCKSVSLWGRTLDNYSLGALRPLYIWLILFHLFFFLLFDIRDQAIRYNLCFVLWRSQLWVQYK